MLLSTALRIREQSPALLLDLGGHTADNHPQFLTQRLASVQATYLGFYGPTYAACCDWWIVDRALMAGSNTPIPEQKRFGPCLVPASVMSPDCTVCLDPNDHHLSGTQLSCLRQL